MRVLLSLCVVALVLPILGGCKPPDESVRVKDTVTAPPDLAKSAPANPANRAFQLRAFQFNHVWADRSDGTGAPQGYRAKLTVWDYDDETHAIAELYFHDDPRQPLPPNSDPAKAKRPFQIHLPMTALGPVLGTLRNTDEPVFLYYYDGAWAVGTYQAEPLGVD